MRRGDFHVCICTQCGKMPMLRVPLSRPLDRLREARRLGFDWIMVKSGEDPIYQWQCSDCRRGAFRLAMEQQQV